MYVGSGVERLVGVEVGATVGSDDGPTMVKVKFFATIVPSASSKLISNVLVPDSIGIPDIHPSPVSPSPANIVPAVNDQL